MGNFLDGSDSNDPNKEGKIGEKLLLNTVNIYFTNRSLKYKTIQNIRIIYEEDKSTEIDMLLICPKGIFIVENKHWNGIIKGKLDGEKWLRVQDGFTYSRVYHYPNPIKQNEFHLQVMKHIFGEDLPFYSLITFSSNNIGRSQVPNVINLAGFCYYMDNFETDLILTDKEIDNYYSLISSAMRE